MAKVFIEESTLTSIGDAIRAKTGDSKKMSPASMVTAIAGITTGGGETEEEFVFSGDCGYAFYQNGWNWFVDKYKDRISTKDISNAKSMFEGNKIEKIPFELNFDSTQECNAQSMFRECGAKEIAAINGLHPDCMDAMFFGCINLRHLPEFNDFDPSIINEGNGNLWFYNVFAVCNSLRSIPEDFLKRLYDKTATMSNYTPLYGSFKMCHVLDEIRGLSPITGTIKSNVFINTFDYCSRVKDIVFDTQDGAPYIANWKNQTIDLSMYVGYIDYPSAFGANSGITEDKEVTDVESYLALANDPDWFTCNVEFSRYGHDSAVNTIQSLPDTSAYLATAGGTNTIKFKGDSGSKTAGGGCSSLTEEEIAIAVSRGFTVTFV